MCANLLFVAHKGYTALTICELLQTIRSSTHKCRPFYSVMRNQKLIGQIQGSGQLTIEIKVLVEEQLHTDNKITRQQNLISRGLVQISLQFIFRPCPIVMFKPLLGLVMASKWFFFLRGLL